MDTHGTQPLSGPLPQDLLLLIFIHGFKGTDSTFLGFPERLKHVVSETVPNVVVESMVFPAYETKGELNAAVERFADWLTTLTVEKEVASGHGGGAGKAKIVLCGHSMGGLVAADTLINLSKSRPAGALLWPRIIACLAFDTPYLGLHPSVFKNSANKAIEYAKTASQFASSLGLFSSLSPQAKSGVKPAGSITAPAGNNSSSSSSPWSKWSSTAAYGIGGALVSGAVAGTAYIKRKDLGVGYGWATDHLKYVGTLWDEETLRVRLAALVKMHEELGIVFKTFYTSLPPNPPNHPETRTFVILPPNANSSASSTSVFRSYFVPAHNNLALDEVQAHTGMFSASTNDSYYELGLETAQAIREAVLGSRSTEENGGSGAWPERRARDAMTAGGFIDEEAKIPDLDAPTEMWAQGNPEPQRQSGSDDLIKW